MADYRRWVLDHFSGTLCVDELHLGRFTLLLATDPLHDLPVAFALVDRNDQDHMRRFLKNLKTWGFRARGRGHRRLEPLPGAAGRAVARSPPSALRLPRAEGRQQAGPGRGAPAAPGDGPAGQPGPQAEAGRPPRPSAERRGLTNKEKAAFVFKHRCLIVKRRDKMTDQERADLATMLSYLPELKILRDFVDRLGMLFEEGQSEAPAWSRHAALVSNQPFLAVPELAKAIGALRSGEVRQDDRLPEEPGVPSGADEQPCGAGQPQAAVRGEGPVQVAETSDDGAVPGAASGSVLAARAGDSQSFAQRTRCGGGKIEPHPSCPQGIPEQREAIKSVGFKREVSKRPWSYRNPRELQGPWG